jgi:hypothetical protein
MSEEQVSTPLTKLETAGALAAIEAVADSAPGGAPEPLRTAADKLRRSLAVFNEEPTKW